MDSNKEDSYSHAKQNDVLLHQHKNMQQESHIPPPPTEEILFFNNGKDRSLMDASMLPSMVDHHIYVSMKQQQPFWFYVKHVNENSVLGYRWVENKWFYYCMNISSITEMYCHHPYMK